MDIQKLFHNLTEEVSCSVCGDVYDQPKQLPCLHSFCLVCLNDLARKRAVNGKIQCPLCQRQVAVPESGTFETLPSSFYINSLLDVLAIKQCGSSHVSCGNCATKSLESSYCFQCCQFWCGECLNAHNILRANSDHRVVELKDFQAKDYEDVFKRRAICKKDHHEKMLEYYCTECEVAACQVCVILEHGGHNIKHLEEVSKEEKAKIMTRVDQVKNNIREYAEQIHKIEQDVLKVQQHGEEMKRQVNSFADELIGAIRVKQRDLIIEIESTTKSSTDRLKADKEKIEDKVENIKSVIHQAENNFLQRGASIEIIQSRKHVEERLGELAADEEDTNIPQYGKLFFAENLAESLTINGIGHLGTSDTDPLLSTAKVLCGNGAQGQRPFFAPRRSLPQQLVQMVMGQVWPGARAQRQLPSRAVAPSQSGVLAPQRVPQVQNSRQGRMAPGGKHQQGVRNQPAYARSRGMAQHEQQTIQIPAQKPLTSTALASVSNQEQKQMLGERLFPLIQKSHPNLAGKITGMLLEIDNDKLLHMLESEEALQAKVEEVMSMLMAHHAKKVAATRETK